MAIDYCLEEYIRSARILVAQELQQHVLQALAASVETSTYTPLTSSSESDSQHCYAEVVQTPKNASRLRGNSNPKSASRAPPKVTSANYNQLEDHRILITVSATNRLIQPSLFAIC
jgi:hypothetical protein